MSDQFQGFSYPGDEGFTRMPHNFLEVCNQIDNFAEVKILLYVARHTWGFQEYGKWKRFTVDEFMHGRMKRDEDGKRVRMDSGTGLSEMSVRHGIKRALEHGYLLEGLEEKDLARKRKYYMLRMCQSRTP